MQPKLYIIHPMSDHQKIQMVTFLHMAYLFSNVHIFYEIIFLVLDHYKSSLQVPYNLNCSCIYISSQYSIAMLTVVSAPVHLRFMSLNIGTLDLNGGLV